MKINSIIESWLSAEDASSRTNNLSCVGSMLFSYSLPIARYGWSDDQPIVYNYTAKDNGQFVSATTSKHITQVWQHLIKNNYQPIMEDPPC
jgi:hypothetical protein